MKPQVAIPRIDGHRLPRLIKGHHRDNILPSTFSACHAMWGFGGTLTMGRLLRVRYHMIEACQSNCCVPAGGVSRRDSPRSRGQEAAREAEPWSLPVSAASPVPHEPKTAAAGPTIPDPRKMRCHYPTPRTRALRLRKRWGCSLAVHLPNKENSLTATQLDELS